MDRTQPQLSCVLAWAVNDGVAGFQVYKGLYRGVQEVAVKVVDSPDPKAQARFVLEIATLRQLRDPNVVMFLAASVQEGQTLLLMQYMQHGNLWNALHTDEESRFSWYRG